MTMTTRTKDIALPIAIAILLSLCIPSALAQTLTVRDVDFANFRYEGPKDYSGGFVLSDGEQRFTHGKEDGIVLTGVEYHDLTGDGREEAIVKMALQTGGSAIPSLVFIYSLKNGKPTSLWKFISGDRADGGLRSISVANGNLTLELNGDVSISNGSLKSKQVGDAACCPSRYSKITLRWNGRKFAQVGDVHVIPLN